MLKQIHQWQKCLKVSVGGQLALQIWVVRVTDIDGVPGDPSTFYVSGADGGIFKTINGGVALTLFLKIKEHILLVH